MTRSGRRLVEDFLLPALNDGRYGDLLRWIDPERQLFCIRWSHKNAAKWTLEDTIVFQDWDRLKGHHHPEQKGYYMQSKQRFRAALYKLNSVRKVPCEDKHVKKYQLLIDPEKRRENSAGRKIRKKEGNQKSIPTSVICKNTAYSGAPKTQYTDDVYPMSSEPSSPASSMKSDISDREDFEKTFYGYPLAQQTQRSVDSSSLDSSMKDEEPCDQRTPIHVFSSSLQQIFDSSQKRYESPRVLLVKTYNEPEDEDEDSREHLSEPYDMEPDDEKPPCVLNLSVKSEHSDALSR